VAESTGYARYWIGQIARRYNANDPEGMHNHQHTAIRRMPTLLISVQIEEMRQALAGLAPHGGRWSGRTVAEWLSARLDGLSAISAVGTICSTSRRDALIGSPLKSRSSVAHETGSEPATCGF
jgi:hypothetical protein